MDFGDNYIWEAELDDGTIITKNDSSSPIVSKGDLTGVIRFTLSPKDGLRLPKHSFIGVKMVRRFGRGFKKVQFNQEDLLPGLFYWMDNSTKLETSKDLTSRLSPNSWIGKGVAGEKWYKIKIVEKNCITLAFPYKGHSKPRGMQAKTLIIGQPKSDYYSCIVFKTHRAYVSHLTGTVLITPVDYELYI